MAKQKFIRQMDITKTPVDVRAFGRNLVATNAAPRINRDTNERTGTDYEIVCIDYDFEKIKVAVDGPQTISDEMLAKGHTQVTLTNLRASLYNINSHVVLSIKADQINPVKQS